MAPLCKFYQQGNCRNGANCRFEHPGATASPFGATNNNRFGALSSGGGSSGGAFGRAASTGTDGTNSYKITKDAIKIDLVDERPQWILSAYGPGRDAPEQLFGGYPREQSFEEIRLSVLTNPNPQQALQEVQNMYLEAEKQIQTAVGNLDGAVQFILAAENKHPNRHDICRQNSRDGGANGAFAVGGTRSGFGGNPLVSGSATNQSPFATTQASPFGAPAAAVTPTTSAFGQPSQMGAKPNPFGQPSSSGGSAFGQPSSLGASSAFGQPSSLGANSAFGQPSSLGTSSAFGQPSSLGASSAFGQPSSLGAKPNPFAASANAPLGFAAAAQQQSSAFGQPSQMGAKPNPFGAPASASPFGAPSQPASASPFGAPSQPATTSPFGAPSQPATASPFGAPSSQPAAASPFGPPSQPANPSPFGAPSQPANASPFGAPSQTQNAAPFGAPTSQPSGAPAANPFGQPAAQPNAFGAPPATANPFSSMNNQPTSQVMDTQSTPAPSNPFGQPATNGFGAPSNATPNGAGSFVAQASPTPAAQGSNSPYPPGSAKQHPSIDSYATRMGTRIVRFKGQPVSYKDDIPGVQVGGHWSKIWFPNGPPNYYADTEPKDKSAYTEAVHKIYEDSGKTGRFAGLMPEVPPLREDCAWDF